MQHNLILSKAKNHLLIYPSFFLARATKSFPVLIYPVISMDSTITHAGSREFLLGKNPSPAMVDRFSNEKQVSENTPPAFLVHSLDDGAVPVQNSIDYALAMQKFNVPCELHIYESGGHGYGLGRSSGTKAFWPEACREWLRVHGLL